MDIVTAKQMQEIDRLSIEEFGIPGRILMENAGHEAVKYLISVFPNIGKSTKIAVMAGKGNNGGDGFVMARYLKNLGLNVVDVFVCAKIEQIQGDAKANLNLLNPIGVEIFELPDENSFQIHQNKLDRYDIIIDALLGTGLRFEITGYYKHIINFINALQKQVFAVDIPSGINADTGQPCGISIKAQATCCFGMLKPGLILYPGAEMVGKLAVIEIGIPKLIVNRIKPSICLMTQDMISSYYMPRKPDAHKGTTGHLLVIAGSVGKTGAASMCALSAMRAGAGLVTLGIPESINPMLEVQVTEVMTAPLPETDSHVLGPKSYESILKLIKGKRAIAIGPGIGTDKLTAQLLQKLIINSPIPLILDADALSLSVENLDLLKTAKIPLILTPHPGEMAKLFGCQSSDIQCNRIEYARNFATSYNVYLVLKGAVTVIAYPDGSIKLNPTGNAGMASGGMGDVLTGMIGGFVVQGYDMEKAIQMAVFIHGKAADIVSEQIGQVGMLASDVIKTIPVAINEIASKYDQSYGDKIFFRRIIK